MREMIGLLVDQEAAIGLGENQILSTDTRSGKQIVGLAWIIAHVLSHLRQSRGTLKRGSTCLYKVMGFCVSVRCKLLLPSTIQTMNSSA
jgi:hypothetical protein